MKRVTASNIFVLLEREIKFYIVLFRGFAVTSMLMDDI